MNPLLMKQQAERLPYGLQKNCTRKKRQEKEHGKMIKLKTFNKWLLAESEDYINMKKSIKEKKLKIKLALIVSLMSMCYLIVRCLN